MKTITYYISETRRWVQLCSVQLYPEHERAETVGFGLRLLGDHYQSQFLGL